MAQRKDTRGTGGNLLLAAALSIASGWRDTDEPADRQPAQQSPARPVGWWAFLRGLYDEINEDRVLAVAGGVTFYGLLALFPAVTAFVSIFGLFADPAQVADHARGLNGILPEGAVSLIADQVARIASTSGASLSLAFVASLGFALWSANAGMKAAMDALNVAYGRKEERSFLKLNLLSMAFTLGALVFLALLIAVIAVIPAVLEFLRLGALTQWLLWAGRWPVIFGVVILGIALLYHYGPSRERGDQRRWITPGSIIAGVGLVAFSMLFSWYAANFGDYNATYGALGAAIGFMTWLWLSTTILLVGAEFNAALDAQGPPGT